MRIFRQRPTARGQTLDCFSHNCEYEAALVIRPASEFFSYVLGFPLLVFALGPELHLADQHIAQCLSDFQAVITGSRPLLASVGIAYAADSHFCTLSPQIVRGSICFCSSAGRTA
jgi:hypothetical protein